jgi:hypothetical protein
MTYFAFDDLTLIGLACVEAMWLLTYWINILFTGQTLTD